MLRPVIVVHYHELWLKGGNRNFFLAKLSSAIRQALEGIPVESVSRPGDRLQMTSLSYVKSGTTLFGLSYYYQYDASNCSTGASGNNGQIQCISDTVDSGRSAHYSYDNLSRLSTGATSGSSGYPAWGLSWTYDRYGNRTAQSVTAGSGPSNSVSVSTSTNRITDSGYGYDSNGNMTTDGYNALVYDAENRNVSASNGGNSGDYIYDGNNLRVRKCVPNCSSPTITTVYIFSGSKVIAEYVDGVWSKDYIYSGSPLVATERGARYALKTGLSGSVSCNNATFTDQMYGVVKACYSQNTGGGSSPAGFSTSCASEGQVCTFSGVKDVAYGASGSFYVMTNVSGGIACNNLTFGDPIVGTSKTCYTQSSGSGSGPNGYSSCASENQTCTLSRTMDVAYGAIGTQYHHPDHLSPRVNTDSSGTKIGEQAHFPFGESWYASNTTTKYQFTTYERDSESGNDYALARHNVNRLGRFSSPDALSGSVGDPQSLNRYSYALNYPVGLTDPLGLEPCEPPQDGATTVPACGLLVDGGDPSDLGCKVDGIASSCSTAGRLARNGALAIDICIGAFCTGQIPLVSYLPNLYSVVSVSFGVPVWRTHNGGPLRPCSGGPGTNDCDPDPHMGEIDFRFDVFVRLPEPGSLGTQAPRGDRASALAVAMNQSTRGFGKFVGGFAGLSLLTATGLNPAVWQLAVAGYNTTYATLAIWQAGDFAGFMETMSILYGAIGGSAVPDVPLTPGGFVGQGVRCLADGSCRRR